MSFFSLWVVERELSFGEGATAEEEKEEDAEGWEEEEEGEGVALMEAAEEARDVFWRGFDALVPASPFGARP